MTRLEEFIRNKALELHPPERRTMMEYEVYKESVVDRYKEYLDQDCPYIHRIGVLALIDGNKMDFCTLLIGMTDAYDDCRFIGELHFCDGENMDLARSWNRIYNLVQECHIAFLIE